MPDLHPPPSALPEYMVKTNPPPGKKKVTEIYWDPDTGEFVFIHE